MNGPMLQAGFILVGASLMLALLGLGAAAIVPGIDQWNKRFFIVYFLCLALYVGFGLAEMISYTRPVAKPALNIILYCDSLFPSVLMPLMTVYLLHCRAEDWRHSPLFRVVAVLWIGFFSVLNAAPFTTWFYYVSPVNQLVRGPLYPLMIAILDVIMVLNLAAVIRWRKKLSKRVYSAFLVGLLPIAIALFIHCFVSVFELLTVSTVISELSMFGIILSDQIEQNLRSQREIAHQQREIAHQRARVMLLQMRPHFIYNTMMSIYYLCKQDPDLAQQVTLDFTTYLRKNFTAIASEDLIPFREELEHTRAYLAVEQAQFEDSLLIDYDTPHTDFRVPPLTLQPIAENAVKHGMDQDAGPLRIFIRTRSTNSGSEIIVENNGADFKPADDSEPHIALMNIQQRLEMMCRGSMTIMPREGGGTVVMLKIP